MKLFAVRHGITALNKERRFNGRIDEPLAPEGREEVEALVPDLPQGINALYASDLLRTRETADILNASLKLSVEYIPAAREVDLGLFNGKTWPEMNEIAGYDFFDTYKKQQYDAHTWSGESADDVRSRVESCLQKIKKSNSDTNALLVTHGGIIRMLYFIYEHQVFDEIKNASVHTFEI